MSKKNRDGGNATLAEAFMHFQIETKTKEIQDIGEEIKQLEASNQRLTELNSQLREEQQGHFKMLRLQVKDLERKLREQEVVNKEQVEQALQENLELAKNQDKHLEEMRSELRGLEEQVLAMQAERDIWLQYKNVGSQEHQQRIIELDGQLAAMHSDFKEMSENIQQSLEVTCSEIDKETAQLTDEENHLATKRAMKHLDKNMRAKMKENDWLKREIAIYQKDVSVKQVTVQQLEEENLGLVNELFENHFSELQISRDVFLTQAASLKSSDRSGLAVSVQRGGPGKPSGAAGSPWPPLRPAAEAWEVKQQQPAELEGDETFASCGAPAPGSSTPPPPDPSGQLYASQPDGEEALHLGSLRHRPLCVVGQTMPLHPAPADIPQDWPITTRMLRNRFL